MTRDKKTEPKRTGWFWCFGCDRNLITVNMKCSECGYIEKNKRRKK